MKNMIKMLSESKNAWLASEIVPADLTAWGVKYLNKEKIGYVFDECAQLLRKLNTIDWQAPVSLALEQCNTYITEIHNYAIATLNQPNPEKNVSVLINNLKWLLAGR